ncbi:hypothetical protein [Pseudaestuariivita rosea]|uniref:hypothetical protein n=1 Tax=Pseudaestuariivita rosea TaxID=2763263 RepID=UPI001ABB0CBF|nr:hypothetical protein [Pseudaestuariivita rosea]
MTATGILIGILAGIGIIAIVVVLAAVIIGRKLQSEFKEVSGNHTNKDVGFSTLKQKVPDLLHSAPRGSFVSAVFPIPTIEVFVKVSGRKANKNSYQLEIRMGYKRFDHLALIEKTLAEQSVKFERIHKGNGSIKLISEKVDETDELLEICRTLKKVVMFDLNDNSITVAASIRKSEDR